MLLVQWSYQERNTHTILYKYGDVCRQMHGESSLQWLYLQVEQCFWSFIRRCQVKHILLSAVLHPDVFWYCLNCMGVQKNAPKKFLVTLFPYIFRVKTKWTIVYKYLKTKIFLGDTNILLKCIDRYIFLDPQLRPLGVFGYQWTIQSLTSR